ncbi:MAG: hypothetical protein HQ522_12840 [Bacteroidetes bacterium]|nr:hypothetical protein [Bacteroidota bacterium]
MIVIFLSELVSINMVDFESIIIFEIPIGNSCSEGEPEVEDSNKEFEDFVIKNSTHLNSCIFKNNVEIFYGFQYSSTLIEILTPPPELLCI